MFSTTRVMALTSAALLAAACARGIQVRTMSAPDAGFSALRTFRMLPPPARRDVGPEPDDDPMISNSIANKAIRERLMKAFTSRGYVRNDRSADFAVAFYATGREKLDASIWDYGYPFNPRWGRIPLPGQGSTYTEGSVVVDVVKVDGMQLLWRGEGKAKLSDDPTENVARLGDAAEAIVARFPAASSGNVAVGH